MAKQLLIKDGKLQTNASGELLIIPDGDSASDCACCGSCTGSGDPCVDCDWVTHSVDPEDAVTTGATNDDETWCTTTPDAQFFSYVENANYCSWTWMGNNTDSGVLFSVIYAKVNGVGLAVGTGCTDAIDAGEWGVALFVEDILNPFATAEWEEQTTGFCCDAATNTINGEHTFSAGPCEGSACGGTPKVSVAVTP